MVAFPTKDEHFPPGAGNVGPVRAGQRGFYDAVRQMPGANASAALTIAAGAVTAARYLHTIDTEAAAAADDLTNILQDNLPDGALISIGSADGARVPTVKHSAGGAGQILLADGADFLLLHPSMRLCLRRDGTAWVEEGRSYGDQKAAARTFLGLSTAAIVPINTILTVIARQVAYTDAHTLTASDNGKIVYMNKVTAVTLTCPQNSTEDLDDGFQVTVVNLGAGQVTVAVEGADALNKPSTKTAKLAEQHAVAVVWKSADGQWHVDGNLELV